MKRGQWLYVSVTIFGMILSYWIGTRRIAVTQDDQHWRIEGCGRKGHVYSGHVDEYIVGCDDGKYYVIPKTGAVVSIAGFGRSLDIGGSLFVSHERGDTEVEGVTTLFPNWTAGLQRIESVSRQGFSFDRIDGRRVIVTAIE